MIMRALRDHPDRAYAGGVHGVVYEMTGKKVIITSNVVCQVFKTLQVRGLIERAETPPEAELARRGRRGGPRKFYRLTDAGHAEMVTVDKIVALFKEREWRQE